MKNRLAVAVALVLSFSALHAAEAEKERPDNPERETRREPPSIGPRDSDRPERFEPERRERPDRRESRERREDRLRLRKDREERSPRDHMRPRHPERRQQMRGFHPEDRFERRRPEPRFRRERPFHGPEMGPRGPRLELRRERPHGPMHRRFEARRGGPPFQDEPRFAPRDRFHGPRQGPPMWRDHESERRGERLYRRHPFHRERGPRFEGRADRAYPGMKPPHRYHRQFRTDDEREHRRGQRPDRGPGPRDRGDLNE